MQFSYKITDITTGKVYYCVTKRGEYSYINFIGELTAMNMLHSGDLEFQENT